MSAARVGQSEQPSRLFTMKAVLVLWLLLSAEASRLHNMLVIATEEEADANSSALSLETHNATGWEVAQVESAWLFGAWALAATVGPASAAAPPVAALFGIAAAPAWAPAVAGAAALKGIGMLVKPIIMRGGGKAAVVAATRTGLVSQAVSKALPWAFSATPVVGQAFFAANLALTGWQLFQLQNTLRDPEKLCAFLSKMPGSPLSENCLPGAKWGPPLPEPTSGGMLSNVVSPEVALATLTVIVVASGGAWMWHKQSQKAAYDQAFCPRSNYEIDPAFIESIPGGGSLHDLLEDVGMPHCWGYSRVAVPVDCATDDVQCRHLACQQACCDRKGCQAYQFNNQMSSLTYFEPLVCYLTSKPVTEDRCERRWFGEVRSNYGPDDEVMRSWHGVSFDPDPDRVETWTPVTKLMHQVKGLTRARPYPVKKACGHGTMEGNTRLERFKQVSVTKHFELLRSGARESKLGDGNRERLGKAGEIEEIDLGDNTVNFAGEEWWVPIRALEGFEEWQPNDARATCERDQCRLACLTTKHCIFYQYQRSTSTISSGADWVGVDSCWLGIGAEVKSWRQTARDWGRALTIFKPDYFTRYNWTNLNSFKVKEWYGGIVSREAERVEGPCGKHFACPANGQCVTSCFSDCKGYSLVGENENCERSAEEAVCDPSSWFGEYEGVRLNETKCYALTKKGLTKITVKLQEEVEMSGHAICSEACCAEPQCKLYQLPREYAKSMRFKAGDKVTCFLGMVDSSMIPKFKCDAGENGGNREGGYLLSRGCPAGTLACLVTNDCVANCASQCVGAPFEAKSGGVCSSSPEDDMNSQNEQEMKTRIEKEVNETWDNNEDWTPDVIESDVAASSSMDINMSEPDTNCKEPPCLDADEDDVAIYYLTPKQDCLSGFCVGNCVTVIMSFNEHGAQGIVSSINVQQSESRVCIKSDGVEKGCFLPSSLARNDAVDEEHCKDGGNWAHSELLLAEAAENMVKIQQNAHRLITPAHAYGICNLLTLGAYSCTATDDRSGCICNYGGFKKQECSVFFHSSQHVRPIFTSKGLILLSGEGCECTKKSGGADFHTCTFKLMNQLPKLKFTDTDSFSMKLVS